MSRFQGALAVLVILCVAGRDARAQYDPPHWTLGVYDDPGLTHSEGAMLAATKELWIGARATITPGEGFVGFEFGVAGLEPFTIISAEWTPPTSILVGDIAAPTDTVSGSGGLSVAWNLCVPSDQAFLKLVIATPSPPEDHVLRITRRFPPSTPGRAFPSGFSCDACTACWGRTHTSDYVLNPSIAVESAGWASIKGLYR
jgi:hypothetical protein